MDSKGQETTFELKDTGAIEAVKKRKQTKGHVVSVLRGFGTTNQMRLLLGKMGIQFTYPKPVDLIAYLLSIFSEEGDIILDSFAGSGTTAHAVESLNLNSKLKRRSILIEMGEDNINNVIVPRMKNVVNGFPEADVQSHGGGFRFYKLGPSVFDETGQIRPDIEFVTLAAHIWFYEVGGPWDKPQKLTPILGQHESKFYALLYNGILGDKRVNGGNVLTRQTLKIIRDTMGDKTQPLVVYGERSALSENSLKRENITFKQTPYDVKARA